MIKNMQNKRSDSGFTLVELLVVIGIIAILAAILLPAMTAAFDKAERAQVQTEVNSIKTAVMAYVNDYGKLPVVGSDQGASDKTYTDSKAIFKVLTANDTSLNPRKTSYLETKTSATDGTFPDSYGTQYTIILDNNYDNKVKYDGKDYGTSVIVVSGGKDENVNTTSDNITTALQ